MNLVAKEYVASRADGRGVLILSEMTGAASEMGEALIVNPNDIPAMALAIETALEMPPEAQEARMAAMRDRSGGTTPSAGPRVPRRPARGPFRLDWHLLPPATRARSSAISAPRGAASCCSTTTGP
jgi:hypothetical protein